MASFKEVGFRPFIRSRIRQGIRAGLSPAQIMTNLEADFQDAYGQIGGVPRGIVSRMIGQESRRQGVIQRLENMPKGKRTNLHAIVGCGAGEVIQTNLSIFWKDPATGKIRQFNHTTTLANQGRLQDILNPAIAEAIADAVGRGYTVPSITSSMLSGSTRYRLNYVECV